MNKLIWINRKLKKIVLLNNTLEENRGKNNVKTSRR